MADVVESDQPGGRVENKLADGAVVHHILAPAVAVLEQEHGQGSCQRAAVADDEDCPTGMLGGYGLDRLHGAGGELDGRLATGRGEVGILGHALPQPFFVAQFLVGKPFPFTKMIFSQPRFDLQRVLAVQGCRDDLGCLAGAAEGGAIDGADAEGFTGQSLGQDRGLGLAAGVERAVGGAVPGAADVGVGLAVADEQEGGWMVCLLVGHDMM